MMMPGHASHAELQGHPACLEATEDFLGWTAQDVRVIEAPPEQEEESVECERQEDAKSACGAL